MPSIFRSPPAIDFAQASREASTAGRLARRSRNGSIRPRTEGVVTSLNILRL